VIDNARGVENGEQVSGVFLCVARQARDAMIARLRIRRVPFSVR
jgi:hypothetical protein